MDAGIMLLVLAMVLLIIFHPATRIFFNHMKIKLKASKNKTEQPKCYHTAEDCSDCMSSTNCPMKDENVVGTNRNDCD